MVRVLASRPREHARTVLPGPYDIEGVARLIHHPPPPQWVASLSTSEASPQTNGHGTSQQVPRSTSPRLLGSAIPSVLGGGLAVDNLDSSATIRGGEGALGASVMEVYSDHAVLSLAAADRVEGEWGPGGVSRRTGVEAEAAVDEVRGVRHGSTRTRGT